MIDVWESEEAFGRFFSKKLHDAMQAAQIPESEPPTFSVVHNLVTA